MRLGRPKTDRYKDAQVREVCAGRKEMFISLNYLLLDLLDIRTWLFVSLLPPNDLIEKHTAQSGKRERGDTASLSVPSWGLCPVFTLYLP